MTWPEGLEPAGAAVHARNVVTAPVPASWAWEWLVRPKGWSRWYRNALAVRCDENVLSEETSFRWITFGLPITSVVDLFHPPNELGWKWSGPGSRGYHFWTLERHSTGCRITTEETQFGPLPRTLRPVLAVALSAGHQYWLEALARMAAGGPPYSDGDIGPAAAVT